MQRRKREKWNRTATQVAILKMTLAGGSWWTLSALSRVTGIAENSVSASLRKLRQAINGGLRVEKRRTLYEREYEYRVIP